MDSEEIRSPARDDGFVQFALDLAKAVRFDGPTPTAASRLDEDLGLDSLQLFELVLFMADLGVELHEEELPRFRTVGDVFRRAHVRADG